MQENLSALAEQRKKDKKINRPLAVIAIRQRKRKRTEWTMLMRENSHLHQPERKRYRKKGRNSTPAPKMKDISEHYKTNYHRRGIPKDMEKKGEDSMKGGEKA